MVQDEKVLKKAGSNHRPKAGRMEAGMGDKQKGCLIIIGGAEDRYGDSSILEEVVEYMGGREARIGIITTATERPQEAGEDYREAFLWLGAKEADILNINTREEANREDIIRRIKNATGFFFTGGDQLRITSILGGTRAYVAMASSFRKGTRSRHQRRASVMSSTMIVEGNSNDAARKCTLKMAPGLSFLEGAIIDQHFDQRGRLDG